MTATPTASLAICSTKSTVAEYLNTRILQIGRECVRRRGAFTIAMSGGSLVDFVAAVGETAAARGIGDPQFSKWHVVLADERCVPLDHGDSNLGALVDRSFLSKVGIPPSQVHGINQGILSKGGDTSTEAIARDYEATLRRVLDRSSDGCLDLAVLGFGPDGHTCSLFPNHALLNERQKWVAAVTDSPKPPPNRITLTLPLLNTRTRHVLICGAGSSKTPVLQDVIQSLGDADEAAAGDARTAGVCVHAMAMTDPPPYPSAMVRPNTAKKNTNADDDDDDETTNTLEWIVDQDAMNGINKRATVSTKTN